MIEELKAEKIVKVKKSITKKRLQVTAEKSEVLPMGEEIMATIPDDLDTMFAGKLCQIFIDSEVAAGNVAYAFKKQYGNMPKAMTDKIDELIEEYHKSFETVKKKATKIAEASALWQKMKGVKGFSAYQLALIMTYMKNPDRFPTPSQLCVYAGVSSLHGKGIAKNSINFIRDKYHEEGKEFGGFNTKLSGRMFVITECLMRQKGWFYHFSQRTRKRLEETAMREGRTFQMTEELIVKYKKEGWKLSAENVGKWYMKDRKNQSLIAWSNSNANRRISRTLLHLIWREWRLLKGLEVRDPYPVEYLGHTTIITLEEIQKFDAGIKAEGRGRKKKSTEEE